jgi:alpha-glucosidase
MIACIKDVFNQKYATSSIAACLSARYWISPAFCISFFVLAVIAAGQVRREAICANNNFIVVEMLADNCIHFECGHGPCPSVNTGIATTPMVLKTNYPGPSQYAKSGGGAILETKNVKLQINPALLSVAIYDKTKGSLLLTSFQPMNLGTDHKSLVFTRGAELDVYGLGQQFVEPGASDINWSGRVRVSGEYGNVMQSFNQGYNGNTQIPIMYAVNGATYENYAIFLDNQYKQQWDFTAGSQWKVETVEPAADNLRFYVFTGQDLAALRKGYMELVGHPLVPPKKMFGLWVSEYGYDDWAELDNTLNSLRANGFPIDGFVLDLQWFGGINPGSENTKMGTLAWDNVKFPNAAAKLADLKNNQGIGIMTIEEAYIGKGLPEYTDLANRGYLVKGKAGDPNPAYIDENPWWGKGGMLDYTNDACGNYWHDLKRQPLITAGVMAHWTDLNEPEMYPSHAKYGAEPGGYALGSEKDAHNLFAFKWLSGIYSGYSRNNVTQRPFVMSRSGAAGIQRFGGAMWSGDIASRLSSLAAQWADQMHMSFSGIDYYGADIGGFHRNLEGDLDSMYTQWYGYGMLFDIPGRPHTENLCNCKKTAPDKIGFVSSNLDNTRLRYTLIPYTYSLAHRAYQTGEPIMPPLVYYYQGDANVRCMAHEKMIGPSLLAAPAASSGQTERDVYLPSGTWYDWYSRDRIASVGAILPKVPQFVNNRYRIPLYAIAGAIIPTMYVDEKTMNALGKRTDGTTHTELMAQVFPLDADGATSSFTLYEDDGVSVAYQIGQVQTTQISQTRNGATIAISVAASQGSYTGAPASRDNHITLVTDSDADSVMLNGSALSKLATVQAFNAAASGWVNTNSHAIMAKSGSLAVSSAKSFVFHLSPNLCSSVYHAICIPGEGNGWNPNDPQRTLQCTGKSWKGRVVMANEKYKFAANGSWSVNWGSDGKQNGPNFPALAAGAYDVVFNEADPSHPQFTLVPGPVQPVSVKFICENGQTTLGTSVYIVGSISTLGTWDPKKAIKLEPDGPYPKWTGVIGNLPANTAIEWKCIKRLEGGTQDVVQWENGANHTFTTPAAGAAAEQNGKF